MLLPGDCENFNTLKRAFADGNVALMECADKATGKYVAVICAVSKDDTGVITFTPMAKCFEGNPYEELVPPM